MTDQGPQVPADRRPGRAAGSNAAGRFEPYLRVPVEDGWEREEELPAIRTEVTEERPRRIITANASPDVPFDRSVNPYRGCEHVIPSMPPGRFPEEIAQEA